MTKRMLSLVMVLAMVLSLFAGLTLTTHADSTATITFADLGLENGVQYSDPFDGGDFTVTFSGGGNDGKYYNTGTGIRVYGGGTMTVAAKSGTITSIKITCASGNVIVAGTSDVGTLTVDGTVGTWTGSAASVAFTRASGSGHWRIQSVEATVVTDGNVHVHSYGDWYSNNDGTHSRDCDDPDGDCTVPTETANCTYGDPVVVAATCSATGTSTKTCTVCGYQDVTVLPIDANAHTDTDNDGVCDNCGEDMPAQLPEITGDIVFGDLNLVNSTQYTDPFTSSNGAFTVTFGSGTNDGKYYNTGTGIRVYNGGHMTVAATSGTITSIVITCASASYGPTATNCTVDSGSFSVNGATTTWTGSAASVQFTSSFSHWRIQSVSVTVATSDDVHVHSYGDWYSNNDGTHSRDCDDPDGDCTVPTETANCTYGDPVVVAATCSATGTSTETCTVCGYQKVTVLDIDPSAHVDSDNDGVCDLCGDDMPQGFVLGTVADLKDGDQVVIVNKANNKALGTTKTVNSNYNDGVDVAPVNGVLADPDDSIIFTLNVVTGGYTFTYNGQKLSMDTSYSSTPWDKANDVWTITDADANAKTVYIDNVGRSGYRLEWYSNNNYWSSYNKNNTGDLFQQNLYIKHASHQHTWDAGTETTAATCTAEGVMTYTCTECSETKTEPIPMLAHADANNDGLCDSCGGTIYTLATTLNEGDSVVIYHPVSKTALTGTASGTRLAAEAVNVLGGLAVTSSSDIAVLTVAYLEGSTTDFYLKSGDSYLTTGETGNSLTLEAEATNYSVWTLDTSSGSALIVNANAAYTSGEDTYPIAVEYYGGNYNGYSWKNNGDTAFYLELYTKAAAPAEVTASYSLTTGAKIGINLYFENLPDGATVEVDGTAVTLDSKNCYTIEVAAKDYATEHTVTVNGGATQVNGTDSLKVSVPGYIAAEDEDQSKTDSGVGTVADVVKAMSNFCYYSATYFGETPSGSLYNDVYDAIGNVTYDADAFAAISANDIEVPTTATEKDSTDNTVITFYGASLVLESETTLRFYFKTGDTEANDLAATDVTVKGGECAKTGKQGAYVYVDVKVAAKDLANGITVYVDYNNQTAKIANYAATTYIKQVLGKTNANEDLVNTLKALYVYYLTAFAYFG